MRHVIALFSIAIFLNNFSAAHAAEAYLWTDAGGNYHITDEPPPTDGTLQDVMPYTPSTGEEKARRREQVPRTTVVDPQTERKCGVAMQARRLAVKAREIARAAEHRAEKKHSQAEELKDRIGYDDERRDDFKDDIRELEDAARRADLLADQARIQAEEADLRARVAAAEVDEKDCSGFY